MSEFAVIIEYDGNQIELDTIDDVSITKQARVTSQPLVNGDIILDHMFREPSTMTIRGEYSLNSSSNVLSTSINKLGDFENIFETIQANGTKCTIYKINKSNNHEIRFNKRENMVITACSWNEAINSVSFTLSFKEVLAGKVITTETNGLDDEPEITSPQTTSFTNTLINTDDLEQYLAQLLKDYGLMSNDFAHFLDELSERKGLAIAGGLITTGAITALAFGPAGWVAGAIVGIGAGLFMLFKSIGNAIADTVNEKQYAIEKFEYYQDAKKNEQEKERWNEFVKEIKEEISSVDAALHMYQISLDEPQEAMINIGDEYYIFTFTKDNVNQKYSMNVTNTANTKSGNIPDISTVPTSLADMQAATPIVTATNGSKVYLVNPTDNKDTLTNYYVLVCDFDPKKYNEIIVKIVKNHIEVKA